MKQGWTEVALGDLALQMRDGPFGSNLKSSHYVDDGVRVIRLQNIGIGEFVDDDAAYISEDHFQSLPKYHCEPGDVLIATLGDPNVRACILPHTLPRALNKADCLQLRCDPTVADRRYVMHVINSRLFQQRAAGLGHGQTRTRVSMSQLRQATVPLPPLEEQKRIAAILDKADELLAKRRAAIAHLDSLTQAIFLDMFGDVGGSAEEFPRATLGSCCTIAGEYGAALSSVPDDAALPRYVRITDILQNGELQDDSVSPAGTESDWQQFILAPGDLLLARSGATVGKAFLFRGHERPHVFAGYLVRFRPDHASVLPEYLFGMTRTPGYARWVKAQQRTVAQPNISASQYASEFVMQVPPIELQSTYARFIGHLRRESDRALSSLGQWQALVASLQARAFRGEL